ncbi:MAG TPA: hypothetical protein VGB03_07500 [Acidimicrobiales bacterium]
MSPLVVVDDHILRDVLVDRMPRTVQQLAGEAPLATTNMYYVRLCKSAAAAKSVGRLLGDWPQELRAALMGTLVSLPEAVQVIPMRDLAWEMAEVTAEYGGVSLLGAEAIVAARRFGATLCVSSEDDGPGIRAAAKGVGVRYRAVKPTARR